MVLEEETTLEKTVKSPEAQHFLNDFNNESEEILKQMRKLTLI